MSCAQQPRKGPLSVDKQMEGWLVTRQSRQGPQAPRSLCLQGHTSASVSPPFLPCSVVLPLHLGLVHFLSGLQGAVYKVTKR